MPTPSPELDALLRRLDVGETPGTLEIMDFGRRPQALDELLDFMRHSDPIEDAVRRRALLPVIVELGRVLVPAHEDVPEHPGPIVTEPKVVHLLVERSYSKDGELRRGAFTTLADLVPAASLAPYPDTLHTVVQEYPATDGALLLLGKSSKPAEALALLQSTPALASSSSDDAIMVRARLGEQAAEDSLLQAYRDADDAKQREAVAWRLGYAGTDRLVDLLADEIRSPETYVWNMGLRRSLRVHVIEGLHQAFPTEPIFWKSGTGWTCRMHIRSRRFDGLWAGQVGRGGARSAAT